MPFKIGQKQSGTARKPVFYNHSGSTSHLKTSFLSKREKGFLFFHQTRKLNVSLTTDYIGFVTEVEFINTSRGPRPPTHNVTFFGFYVFCNTSKVWNNKHTLLLSNVKTWIISMSVTLIYKILRIWLPAGISVLWHATVGSLDIVWITVTTNIL